LSIKSLASETLWYGLSNIVGRFLNYFLSLILIYLYKPAELASVFQVYVIVPFLNILFTLGLETSYFRFSKSQPAQQLFNTINTYILGTTAAFTIIMAIAYAPIISVLDLSQHTTYYFWMLAILAIDTLCAIPFVKLRQQQRPKVFAIIKLLNIVVNVAMVVLFLVIAKGKYEAGHQVPTWLYNPQIGVGYFIIANLIASIATFVMLLPQWRGFKFQISTSLLKQIIHYSWPIIIVGFGGMINDFISRLMYYKLLPGLSRAQLDHEFGVFNASYKLAVLATLFIQVFKMGAEPFFFKQSTQVNAQQVYARVTKLFSIICCFLFLIIALNLEVLQYIIALKHKEYAQGLKVVPILTLANIFLGIYYNLTVWYKNTDNTLKGAIITLLGVAITIITNIILVPQLHYLGSAYSTFICYTFMMVVSYIWGQKVYPIPYQTGKIILYFGISIMLYNIYVYAGQFVITTTWYTGIAYSFIASAILLLIVLRVDDDPITKSIKGRLGFKAK
jgi:O-antigen/teichoic acid export membrane protein